MRRTRREGVAIGFTALWLTVWTAGILAVLWAFGGALLRGEWAAILFIALWLAGAGFALWKVAGQLRDLVVHGRVPRRRPRQHSWKDGMTDTDPR